MSAKVPDVEYLTPLILRINLMKTNLAEQEDLFAKVLEEYQTICEIAARQKILLAEIEERISGKN